jgi:spore maturation protein A
MIIISVIIGMSQGLASEMVNSIFDATKSATENCINIIGMICLWSGIMRVAEECGIVSKLSKVVSPILNILFPKLKKDSEARGAIALNMTANLLGLGNVATPLGLSAMEKMQEENLDKNTLTNEMMMLIVINTASIQLIPTSIIALRVAHGSTNPVIVVVPILIASLVSVLAGVLIVKFKCRR